MCTLMRNYTISIEIYIKQSKHRRSWGEGNYNYFCFVLIMIIPNKCHFLGKEVKK